jgi:type III secretory pathway component EscV
MSYASLVFCLGKSSAIDRAGLSNAFQQIQAEFFNETAVVMPLVEIREAKDLDNRTCRFLMNEVPLITFTSFASDEFWVDLPLAQVTSGTRFGRSWKAREHQLPGSPPAGAIVNGDEQARSLWQKDGYTTVTHINYPPAVAYNSLRSHTAELLSPDLVDYYLYWLSEKSSVLVESVRQRFTLEALTAALQSFLLTKGSIKNLSGVLEELLENE